jgi:hypothetical protein
VSDSVGTRAPLKSMPVANSTSAGVPLPSESSNGPA